MICPRHELLLKRPVDFVGTNEAAAKKGILTSSGRGGDGGSGGRGVGGSGGLEGLALVWNDHPIRPIND